MTSLAMALPVQPGKADQLRATTNELLGARRQEFEESEKRIGITRECQYLQPTPMGDLLVVWVEGGDVVAALAAFGQSYEPVDAWWKEQILEVTGIDLNQPPQAMPEVVLDWSAADAATGERRSSLAMAMPVQPGKADRLRAMRDELVGARRQQWEESERRLGIPREGWYLQPSPMGDLFLLWAESDDITAAFTSFIQSREPFDVWFKEQMRDITDIDLNEPPPGVPEVLMDWSAPAGVR
jgi:hypothetical protein